MSTPEEKTVVEELVELFNSARALTREEAKFIHRRVVSRAFNDFQKTRNSLCLFILGHSLIYLGKGKEALSLFAEYTPSPDINNPETMRMNMGYASILYLTGDHKEAYRRAKPFEPLLSHMQLVEIDKYPLICLENKDFNGMKKSIEVVVNIFSSQIRENIAAFGYMIFLYYINIGNIKSILEFIKTSSESGKMPLKSQEDLDKIFSQLIAPAVSFGIKNKLTDIESSLIEDAQEIATVLIKYPYEKIFFNMHFEYNGKNYTAQVFRNPDDRLSAEVLEVPGCFTWANNEEELKEMLVEALSCHLEAA